MAPKSASTTIGTFDCGREIIYTPLSTNAGFCVWKYSSKRIIPKVYTHMFRRFSCFHCVLARRKECSFFTLHLLNATCTIAPRRPNHHPRPKVTGIRFESRELPIPADIGIGALAVDTTMMRRIDSTQVAGRAGDGFAGGARPYGMPLADSFDGALQGRAVPPSSPGAGARPGLIPFTAHHLNPRSPPAMQSAAL